MKIKNFFQKIRLQIGKALLDSRRNLDEIKNIKKVIFLRQDGKIGDYIVSSFVFRELKRLNPDLHIAVVCTKKDAYLFKQNNYIDQLFFVKRRNIIDYIKTALRIRKDKYDVAIDPTVVIKNRDLLLLRLINAKYYVGYQKSNFKLFNLNIEGDFHFSELYQQAIEKIGFKTDNLNYDVPFELSAQDEIKEYCNDNNLNDYIAINFFGAARIKKVNNENIKKYLQYLTNLLPNKKFVLLSYPEVTSLLRELSKEYNQVFVHDTKTIFHTIELIRYCDQLISTDTSTVHIASGFNKKIIAIYRDDKKAVTNWSPRSEGETHLLFYKENINELSPEAIKPEWLN